MRSLFFLLICLVCSNAAYAFRQVDLLDVLPAGQPTALAIDPEGRIYTAQENGTVLVLAPTGETLMTLGAGDAGAEPLLRRPAGIAFSSEHIFVTDTKLNRVAIFDRHGKFLRTFGTSGDAPKQFSGPTGVAFAAGLLFVADTGRDRVQVFGPDGVYMATIGRDGAEATRLYGPTLVTVDPGGRLWVLNDDGTLKSYDLTGKHLGTLKTGRSPSALAADAEGVYLADRNSLQICKFDGHGKELFCFGSKGMDRSQFMAVNGLAVTGEGRIFVADRDKGTVQILAADAAMVPAPLERPVPLTAVRWRGELGGVAVKRLALGPDGRLYGIAAKEKALLIFNDATVEQTLQIPDWDPVALAVGADGAIWVVDGEQERVLKLDQSGKVTLSFGSSGSGDGRFDDPSAIVVSPKGLVYVADQDNERVQVFNASGTFLNFIGVNRGENLFENPEFLALDDRDNLLVLDTGKRMVSVFGPNGERLRSFGGRGSDPGQFEKPVGLAVTPNEILVLDAGTAAVKVFSSAGAFLRQFGAPGKGPGDLLKPSALLARGDTEILVADTGNRRIQSFGMLYTAAMPTSLLGNAGQRQVNLYWDQNRESYVTGYRLYRSLQPGGTYQVLADLTGNTYLDRDVQPDQHYFYRVTALSRDGNESAAAPSLEMVPSKVVPAAPVNLAATAQEWSTDLTWQPGSADPDAEFRVYRLVNGQPVLVGKSATPSFYEGNLESDSTYQYAVSAVSIDGVESAAVPVQIRTQVATLPPLEIAVLWLSDVFSNTYKFYETEGIGRLRITNNTRDQISNIKVALNVKGYMDFPTEIELRDLGPRTSEEITLRAVFNNQILTLTEDTPVQGEISAAYFKNQELKTFVKIHTVKIFEKHRMTWDERERFSAFVTPKDPVILEFTRTVISQFNEFDDPLLYAGVAFDALGVLGVGYLQDPSNPYQVTSGRTDFVDYLQYPRETLNRRSGDCDDLVGLYASMLESIGIATKVLEVPGHMFMMLAPYRDQNAMADSLAGMLVEFEGNLWIPIEVTQVGSPFMKAWETGIRNYQQWRDKELTSINIRSAWERYKPASLPMTEWRPAEVTRAAIEARYRDELPTLRKIRVQNLSQPYLARLKNNPNDGRALMQLGIAYAKAGEVGEAITIFEKARVTLPNDAALHNNRGNAYFLTERYTEAAAAYADAVKVDPADPFVWVNLARTQLRRDKKPEAAEAFKRALALMPEIGASYRALAIALGTPY